MTTKEKQCILKLLELYREMPFLWNKQHDDYTNRERRSKGNQVLLEIYRHVEPDATVRSMGKKIANLRTNYKKELEKVLASEQAGGDVYVPTLWYFEAMSFLDIMTDSCHNVSYLSANTELGPDVTSDPFENMENALKYEDDSMSSGGSKRMKKVRTEVLKYAPSETANSTQDDDQWHAYGKAIGYQLRDLDGPQLAICQKLISDAVFYAKLNKLNENSHIVNPTDDY